MNKLIVADSNIQHGKPCFSGTRIPVYIVLELLEGGVKPDQIVGEDYYPQLSLKHIRAALHFAVESAKNFEYTPFVYKSSPKRKAVSLLHLIKIS